jgi:SAM-dependent methyltransferase
MGTDDSIWHCPVCGGSSWEERFRTPTTATEGGVDAERFRPASSDFGSTAGLVVRCTACGHGSLLADPAEGDVDQAYLDAADPASVREEAGQVATATRDLQGLTEATGGRRGRLVDVGCWTGSFVAAAGAAGWDAEGIEPSTWAVRRAHERGLAVRQAALGDGDGLPDGAFTAVVACDVLEHLLDPGGAVDRLVRLLEPGGALFATVPDAGSALARAMGRRWWSVLPMHVQYYTRASITRLLEERGLRVRRIDSHAKLFSRRYYGERIGEFVPVAGPRFARWVDRTKGADRLTGPDFRDRMAVVAVRPGPTVAPTAP